MTMIGLVRDGEKYYELVFPSYNDFRHIGANSMAKTRGIADRERS